MIATCDIFVDRFQATGTCAAKHCTSDRPHKKYRYPHTPRACQRRSVHLHDSTDRIGEAQGPRVTLHNPRLHQVQRTP